MNWCTSNDCEDPECHRCFPRSGCDDHVKCIEGFRVCSWCQYLLAESGDIYCSGCRSAIERQGA